MRKNYDKRKKTDTDRHLVQVTHQTEPYAPVPICFRRVYFSGTSHTVLLISCREK